MIVIFLIVENYFIVLALLADFVQWRYINSVCTVLC